MICGGSGDTRMMTTKIPFFREIIICSFECDDCRSTNNEVTFGGEIQEKGIRYTLEVKFPFLTLSLRLIISLSFGLKFRLS